MTTLNDAVKAINQWGEVIELNVKATKLMSERIAELERKVKDLESRPVQHVHHYMPAPLQLGPQKLADQPFRQWDVLCSGQIPQNGNVGGPPHGEQNLATFQGGMHMARNGVIGAEPD